MSTTNILDLNNRIDALEKKEDQNTTDYEQLSHLPKINSVELKGNKSSSDLGLANDTDIAPTFSDATGYSKGDLVYYDGALYQFTADHAAGAWTGTDAQQKDVSDIVNGLTASDVAYDNTDSGLTATDVQGAVDELRQADNIMLSDSVTSVEDALDGLTIAKIDEAAANQTYQKQLTDLTNSYNSLSDRQKQRAYIMVGTTKFISISTVGQFMHHDASESGLVATTLNCITHTSYNVNSSSAISIGSNTNTNTIALYA